MTVKDLCEALSLRVLAGESGTDRTVTCGYVGDLLSWVMGRGPADSVWITVMGNINALAVAKLADISCILLCENASLDEDARQRADLEGIPVLASEEPAWPLAVAADKLLRTPRP